MKGIRIVQCKTHEVLPDEVLDFGQGLAGQEHTLKNQQIWELEFKKTAAVRSSI